MGPFARRGSNPLPGICHQKRRAYHVASLFCLTPSLLSDHCEFSTYRIPSPVTLPHRFNVINVNTGGNLFTCLIPPIPTLNRCVVAMVDLSNKIAGTVVDSDCRGGGADCGTPLDLHAHSDDMGSGQRSLYLRLLRGV